MDTAVVALSRECTYLDAYALLQRAARADARGDARGGPGPGDEIPVVESQASPLLIASPSPSPSPSPNPNPITLTLTLTLTLTQPRLSPDPNPIPELGAPPVCERGIVTLLTTIDRG